MPRSAPALKSPPGPVPQPHETAADRYGYQIGAARAALAQIEALLVAHAAKAAAEPLSYGYAGDLSYVNEQLGTVVEFLTGGES